MFGHESGKKAKANERRRWRKIPGLKAIRKEILSFVGLEPDWWVLMEVKTARASVELCRIFGVTSWCVNNIYDARRHLPLYFFMRQRGEHLSLLGCYSDEDCVLSDRDNKDMYETDRKMFKPLAKMLLSVRPKVLVMTSFVVTACHDLAEVVPDKASKKVQAIMIQNMVDTARKLMETDGN